MHEIEHYDFSEELDEVLDLLTDEENAILLNMVDMCADLEFSKDPDTNFDACDYAFEMEKCWKKVDPQVNLPNFLPSCRSYDSFIHSKPNQILLWFFFCSYLLFLSFLIIALLCIIKW